MDYAAEMIRNLNREFTLCSELLYLIRAQRGTIISGDVVGLAELVSRAEEKVGQIRAAEVDLADMAERYAASIGAKDDNPEGALTALIDSLDEEEKAEFEGIRDSIADVLADIDSTNATNAVLLQDSIQYIENTVKLIAEADGTNSVYSRLGLLDQKAVSSAVDDTA